MNPIFRYHPNPPVAFTLNQHRRKKVDGRPRHMRKRSGKVVTFKMTVKAEEGIPVTIELPDGSRVRGTFCTEAEGRATLHDRAALKAQLLQAMRTGQEIEIYEDE